MKTDTNSSSFVYKFSPLALALGIGIGTAVGVALDQLAIWLPLGIALGATFQRNTIK